jgi:trigger factor
MEAEREEYHAIAERRVRLGLLLSEIGQANGIEISNQEMNQIIMQAAQQYNPQDRERFVEYVRNEPMAAAQLRAPLFEDKVVDFLFAKAEITDRSVSREQLQAEIEAEDGGHVHGPDCNHDHDHDHEPKEKKAKKPSKKAKAEDAAPAEEAQADAPAPKKKAGKKKADVAEEAPAAEAPAAEAPAAEAKPKKSKPKKS